MSWPDTSTEALWDAVRKDESALSSGVSAVCRALAVDDPAERFSSGSLPVYALGETRVLKIYPPLYVEECEREATVLETIDGELSVPTPRAIAHGTLDGWGYLLMSRLGGSLLSTIWPDEASEQARVVEAVGAALRELHALVPIRSSTLWRDGPSFIAQQASRCAERQRAKGLEERWVSQIDPFLASFSEQPLPDGRARLLHTEVMREHLLAERTPSGELVLTGLFDFEPAMMGHPEYELSSVGLFLTRGDRSLLRRLLLSYGYRERDLDAAFSQRILGYALLHRYSKMTWYMERLPPPPGVERLEDLAECWFGL